MNEYNDIEFDDSSYVRQTSIDAYNFIVETGGLSKKKARVYDNLYCYGPCTVNEMWQQMNGRSAVVQTNIHSTITQLVGHGVVLELGVRKCRVTGVRATVYDCNDKYPVRPKEKESNTTIINRMRTLLLWICDTNPHLRKDIYAKARELKAKHTGLLND